MPIIAIALVLAAALGGGVSVAANSAVPGDVLYPFKLDVNEQVEGVFADSDTAKANLDIALAQERLEEAQHLAAQSKLNASAQTQLSANFNAHVQNVSNIVADLQAKGDYQDAATIATKFQAALAQESSTLASANASGDVSAQTSLAPIAAQVATTLNAASTLSMNASAQAAENTNVSADANSTSSLNKAINLGL